MSSTREIKERIGSIQNTLKITNAMYLISSTKMNNAKASLAATEPYFLALESMFARVLRHLPPEFHHPFLDSRQEVNTTNARRAVICVTADKGLAGAYNHNVLKLTMDQFRPDTNDRLYVIGEVGRAWFAHRGVNVDEQFHYTAQKPTLDKSRQIAAIMLDLFTTGKIDEVYIIYTRMKNSMETQTEIVQLLPLVRLNSKIFAQPVGAARQEEFAMYPDPETLLDNIVPDFLSGYIYSALVESYCSEHSSRMQAMDSANKAGQKLLSQLQIAYNRERQAAITQEITEVAAGARARKEQLERAAKAAKS
ncbi:MAG: ATP synthase F1 subunit gamma [Firmicutes bacterium]|nr:ATP synthase F1 subunit gamma [Bacillota bacterium]